MPSYWLFLALAFGITWLIWIPTVRLQGSVGIAAFGSAGPAIAAMLLSYRGERNRGARVVPRVLCFSVCLLLAWLALDLNIAWRGAWRCPVRWEPWLLFPAAVSAWICSGAFSRDTGIRTLLHSLIHPPNWKWPVISLLSVPAVLLLPLPIAHALHLPIRLVNPGPSAGPRTAYGLIAILFNFFIAAVLEEPGWRGFLLKTLQTRFSPLQASLLVWFPWALWHLPMDLVGPIGQSFVSWFFRRVVLFIPLTILFTWLYNRSGQALASAALFHTSLMFANVLPYALPSMGLALVWAAWVLIADRMWRFPEARVHAMASQYD
jgi:membrane protease YdiL (CAAX protease family)